MGFDAAGRSVVYTNLHPHYIFLQDRGNFRKLLGSISDIQLRFKGKFVLCAVGVFLLSKSVKSV
jgi:hypothetical protein